MRLDRLTGCGWWQRSNSSCHDDDFFCFFVLSCIYCKCLSLISSLQPFSNKRKSLKSSFGFLCLTGPPLWLRLKYLNCLMNSLKVQYRHSCFPDKVSPPNFSSSSTMALTFSGLTLDEIAINFGIHIQEYW